MISSVMYAPGLCHLLAVVCVHVGLPRVSMWMFVRADPFVDEHMSQRAGVGSPGGQI